MKRKVMFALMFAAAAALFAISTPSQASVAYGSINNFDTVNDTGVPCHGFEIEIDDIHSKDITYTYDWNHYGVPKITEDNSNPLHPKVFVRYESKKNPDGTWASFTSVPAGPIAPTDGHQFTNPSVNFGGEHFGVGFYGTPTAVQYNWLIDDGAGNLVHGGAVNISTPAFTFFPPVNAAPPQVQAVIVPPPPPAPPPLEFGEASWVKETRTQTHNNNKVELRDLVSDDPNDPNDRNWKNGEPDEVEVEWQILQTDYNSANGGANGELAGAPEDLPNGDEIITRRYDFFNYVGPLDTETGEAMADKVAPDGIHGVGSKFINGATVDLSAEVVVGDYIGAQMAGFDPAGQIGLIDHLQDGEVFVPYVERAIVIGGTPPIVTTRTGLLPDGMAFNEASGILSGTPTVIGTFTFTIHSMDANVGNVTGTYHLTIVDPNVVQPLHVTVTTFASPPEGGTTLGDGEYIIGTTVTVVATANPGFEFLNWTDGGTVVSTLPTYEFVDDVNRELVANFVVPGPTATETYTPTETATPTDTGVPTAINTDTRVPTATNTDTQVPRPTDTDTPVPTATNTDTVAPTPTDTDTPVPTATNTDTLIPTPTDTNTSVSTATHTDTPIPTVTNTNTLVPTPTDTKTRVATPSNTHRRTPTPTKTYTTKPTVTSTRTPIPTRTFTPAGCDLPADINNDNVVNVLDLRIVARSLMREPDDPKYDPRADINGDGRIDVRDLAIVIRSLGDSCRKGSNTLSSVGSRSSTGVIRTAVLWPTSSIGYSSRGDEISVDLMIEDVHDLSGYQMDLHYDPDKLEIQSWEGGDILQGSPDECIGCEMGVNTSEAGVIRNIVSTWTKPIGVSGSGRLFTARFLQISDSPGTIVPAGVTLSGEGTINLGPAGKELASVIALLDAGFDPVVEIPVAVRPLVLGSAGVDLNQDGQISVVDLLRMLTAERKEKACPRDLMLFEFSRHWEASKK
jgi:hypothetical protein